VLCACSGRHAPIVDSFEQSDTSAGDAETLTFRIRAHDPDGRALRYTWSATHGDVIDQNDANGGSQISWRSPACAASTPALSLVSVDVADADGIVVTRFLGVTTSCPTCMDGVRNGSETDVDCGGTLCEPCPTGDMCAVGSDCASLSCAITCQPPTCNDGVQNGDETAVDCGGSCSGCVDGSACVVAGDCASKVCTGHTCIAPTCSDGVQNGNETAVDCGGGCAPCNDGSGCMVANDCVSQTCINHLCVEPSCTDGVQDGGETDIDCGGPSCAPCPLGDTCLLARDCVTLPHAAQGCSAGRCVLQSCVGEFLSCDMNDTNGCETPYSTAHCGDCNTACTAGQLCEIGRCVDPVWSQVAAVTGTPVTIGISPNTGGTPYVIYVGTNGDGVFHSSDGVTWASSGPAITTAAAPMPNAAVCFVALPDATVDVTANSGGSYSSSGSSGAVINSFIAIAGVGPMGAATDATGSAIMVHGLGPAGPWITSTPFGTGTGTSIAFGGAATVFVGVNGSDGGVFQSTNAGANPATFTQTSLAQSQVLSVAVAPSALTHVFAGTSGQGIFRSIDGAATWSTSGTGLGNLVVHALAVDRTDANNIYAGTDSGIYVSKDGGDTWVSSPGLVGAVVSSLAVLNGTPSTVYAATDRGLFVTTTGGQ
jgi:hypothetical protein